MTHEWTFGLPSFICIRAFIEESVNELFQGSTIAWNCSGSATDWFGKGLFSDLLSHIFTKYYLFIRRNKSHVFFKYSRKLEEFDMKHRHAY